jgi:hypothetical protein
MDPELGSSSTICRIRRSDGRVQLEWNLPRDVRCPIGFIRRQYGAPPDQHRSEGHYEGHDDGQARPKAKAAERDDGCETKQNEQGRRDTPHQFLSRQAIPKGKRGPSGPDGNGEHEAYAENDPRLARSGDAGSAPSAERASTKLTKTARVPQCGPSDFCRPLCFCAAHSKCSGDCRTSDCRPLASCWISLVLALGGALRIHGELLKLGIDVGQTSVARHPKAGSAQSWRWHRIDRSVRRSDDLISVAVWPSDFTT